MGFEIRRAKQSDVEKLLELRMALLQEVGNVKKSDEKEEVRQANKRYYEEHLETRDFICYVAESQGEIVGTIGLIQITRPPYVHNLSGLDGYIMGVYTVPPYRGKGIATALLDTCMAYAKNHQIGRIILNASENGRPVYEKRGFKLRHSAMELKLNG